MKRTKTQHDLKVEAAVEALKEVFSDTTVDVEDVKTSLRSIKEDIDVLISAL